MINLMTYRDRGSFVLLPKGIDYEELYRGFVGGDADEEIEKHGWPNIWTVHVDDIVHGVATYYDLSYGGANFILFQWPGITKEMVDKAKKEIKFNRDVQSLRVMRLKSIVNLEIWDKFTTEVEA